MQEFSDEHKNNKPTNYKTARDVQRRRGKTERGNSIKFALARQFWRLNTKVENFSKSYLACFKIWTLRQYNFINMQHKLLILYFI
jgi:hypothetical protein